jgi:hypothetical protein
MAKYDTLSEDQLEEIREMIEEMDFISELDEDTPALIEERWPWLSPKLPARHH